MRKRALVVLIAVLMVVPVFMTGCSRDDIAIVRIELKNMPQDVSGNGYPILEKIFRFFVPNAFAGATWLYALETLNGKVSAPDLEDITFSIPKTETQLSLELPAGPARKITVNGTNISLPGNTWGGYVEVNLNPGDEITAQIDMLPMTRIWMASPSTGIYLQWATTDKAYGGTGYNIYRSVNSAGPYEKVKTVSGYGTGYTTDNNNLKSGTTYYYKICVTTADGEGELSSSTYSVPY